MREGMIVDDLLDDDLNRIVEIQADGTNYLFVEPLEINDMDERLRKAPVEKYEYERRFTNNNVEYLYVFVVVKEE